MTNEILAPLSVVVAGALFTGSLKLVVGWINRVNTNFLSVERVQQETLRQLSVFRAEFDGHREASEQATDDIARRLERLESNGKGVWR